MDIKNYKQALASIYKSVQLIIVQVNSKTVKGQISRTLSQDNQKAYSVQ